MILRSKAKQPSHDDDHEEQRLLEDVPKGRKGSSKWSGITAVIISAIVTGIFFGTVAFFAFSPKPHLIWSVLGWQEGISECQASPWKPDENLAGLCVGVLRPDGLETLTTANACAKACCAKPDCITWQFRTHCLHGPDVRVGYEKDGPAEWCHHVPPAPWQGQMLGLPNDDGSMTEDRAKGCNLATWDPNEQMGQCFGLGDVRKEASGSAAECMQACCQDVTCKGWQWQLGLGCFYGSSMNSCTIVDDSAAFDPFVGRRKKLSTRAYTGVDGIPV